MYELNVEFIPKRGRTDMRANLGDGCDFIAADLFYAKKRLFFKTGMVVKENNLFLVGGYKGMIYSL
ncbi:hypothetical protein [Paenibacillus tundrae]|uniref:hypothetical protein n=1 Tax=Paenibacillus tundrae TaxID=528187 RepID=UPI0022A8E850|nr:hypothetical protein [Paenibacillus tundrae]MCZ1265618.1 hypothetical protein [Paenibacillus tundrae]